ncbi:MAG: hypothetical protein NC453_16700 [Muribaculum sp.]|nr:hypothetical protein [Muribaculum sp.]
MFIDAMSSKELLAEYSADLPQLQSLTSRFDQSEYVTRYLNKRKKSLKVVITKVFTTSRGNRYLGLLFYYQSGYGKNKGWDWSSYHIGLMNSYKGLCAIAFFNESNQALKFTPHFFKRYKERFYKIADWQTRNELTSAKALSDIVAIYMKRNLSITWIETKSVFRNTVHIFGPINDGVALLQWDKKNKVLQANTFVTEDMLDEKQYEMVQYARIYFSLSKQQRKKFSFPDFLLNDESSDD